MFDIFDEYKNLSYGISTKADGPMELEDGTLKVTQNRNKFFKTKKLENYKTINPVQSHSTSVAKVALNDIDRAIKNTDGSITSDRNLLLTVTVADCFPIYFYDPTKNIIAIAHSGWRGTVGNIAGKTVKAIGQNPKNIIVGIGPGIQACHFEIKNDILDKFSAYKDAVEYRENKIFVNLPKIIKSQLTQEGILSSNIENSGECTFCQKDRYFSYRRDKPPEVQAMVAYIGMA